METAVHHPLPAHVLKAILTKDTEALRCMGRRGSERRKEKRCFRPDVATNDKDQADLERHEAILAEYYQAQRLRDAHTHAMRNLIGFL